MIIDYQSLFSHLLWILELGRRHVPYPAHRLQRRLVEKRRLSIHHLHYHDTFNIVNKLINKSDEIIPYLYYRKSLKLSTELIGSLKLGNFWVFVQLIFVLIAL